MVKKIYNSSYLENQETLFIVSIIILILIIITTCFLVYKELKRVNK